MKIFIARDGIEGFYDLEKYLQLLSIDYGVINCEPNTPNEEIAKQIFFNTGISSCLILKENQIISSYQLKNILTDAPREVYLVSFPKICYNYKNQDGKKILDFACDSFPECNPLNLWTVEYLSKYFDISYEDAIFNMSVERKEKIILNTTHGLIFQFNKTT